MTALPVLHRHVRRRQEPKSFTDQRNPYHHKVGTLGNVCTCLYANMEAKVTRSRLIERLASCPSTSALDYGFDNSPIH